MSRLLVLEAMIGLSSTAALHASTDLNAWNAYEAVEEGWIRDRHELMLIHAPQSADVALLDLEVKLADLKQRGIQFRHLLSHDPRVLRGGVWQLTSLPISQSEAALMIATNTEYRKQRDRVRHLTEGLRRHPGYAVLQKEQVRLWKTPQYQEIHRRYMGKMQELQRMSGSATSVIAAPMHQAETN
ncbi:MAG: hypothetical protein H7Y20_10405 [Bryobacteraceae bacterium]|nr:hypothetical protein [Bryobacteraceae bacterium]